METASDHDLTFTASTHRPGPWKTRTRLVGRERELEELDAAFERAAASRSLECVLVLGDPGVGKTRLAQEVLERHGAVAVGLSARAHPLSETASFGMWAEALEHHMRVLGQEEITRLCGGLLDDLAGLLWSVAVARDAPAPPNEPARPRLLTSIGTLLANLAAERPLIVVLDDIHQADPSSWDVLHFLAGQPAGAGIVVIGLARTGELPRTPVAMRVLLDLETQGMLHRMALDPLSDEAVVQLVHDVLGPQVDGVLRGQLVERARGNPFFALGLLQSIDESVHAISAQERGVPQAIAAGVLARVGAISSPARQLLDLLAVAGRSLELGELALINERPLDAIGPDLEELVQARLVDERSSSVSWAYEISHPLIEETLSDDITGARRVLIHRQVGRILLQRGKLGEAAQHFARSAEADDDEAITVLTDALSQADRRGSYREGIALLGVLGELIPAGDERWVGVAGALDNWMFDHRADGDTGTAVDVLARIDALPASALSDERRAAIKGRLATLLAHGAGRVERAIDVGREALQLFAGVGDETSALLARLEIAYFHALTGDLRGWGAEAGAVLEQATMMGDDTATEAALGASGTVRMLRGDFVGARNAYEHAIKIARRRGEPYRVVRQAMKLGWCEGYAGQPREADAAFEMAKAADPAWRESVVLELEANARWVTGELDTCLACAEESALIGVSLRRGTAHCFAALANVEADLLHEAHESLAQARAIYDGPSEWFFASSFFRHAEGVLAWHEQRHDEALSALSHAARYLLSIDAPVLAAPMLVDIAELACDVHGRELADMAATELGRLAESSGTWLHRAMAEFALAAGHLARDAQRQAVPHADRAVELLRHSGYDVLLGRALLAAGRARLSDDPGTSIAALEAAAVAFDQAGAVWRRDTALRLLRTRGTAGRRAAASALGADTLTPREREIARLSSRRMTAQEIADLLSVVSRRTVESHMANIYAKLGVHSKAQLIRALAERPDRIS